MRTHLSAWRRWTSAHELAVAAAIVLAAAVIGAWDMIETGFIAVFAEGTSAGPAAEPRIPLIAIAIVAGILTLPLLGRGQPKRRRLTAFAIVALAAYMAWLPAIIAFLVVWGVTLSVLGIA